MARPKAFTKKRRQAFLEKLTKSGNVSAAARTIGMSRCYMYDLRTTEESFAPEWDSAQQEFLDACENELLRRALEGSERVKRKTRMLPDENGQAGKILEVTEEVQEIISDANLRFYLGRRHPDYEIKTSSEHTGADGGPIEFKQTNQPDLSGLNYAELCAYRALLQKADDAVVDADPDS